MRAEQRQEAVRAMTKDGMTAKDIAAHLGISTRQVVRHRVASGVAKPAAPRITEEQTAIAAALLDDGCSLAEAARTVGASPRWARRHFPGRGWSQEEVREYARFILRHNNVA
jgi:predicted ArsR family transcriptional regulator